VVRAFGPPVGVKLLQVRQGRLIFDDQPADRIHEVSSIELTLPGLGLDMSALGSSAVQPHFFRIDQWQPGGGVRQEGGRGPVPGCGA